MPDLFGIPVEELGLAALKASVVSLTNLAVPLESLLISLDAMKLGNGEHGNRRARCTKNVVQQITRKMS
jgi:hypothetical protein